MTKVDGKDMVGGGAGGHWDPDKTGAHKGPYDKTGHKGDLPAVYVTLDYTVSWPHDLREAAGAPWTITTRGSKEQTTC